MSEDYDERDANVIDETDLEDFDLENDIQEGEVNMFGNMPWINENIGSMMEAALTQYREPNQCRSCGKIDESLRTKKVEERFCSDKCSQSWHALLDTRVKQGLHDLRTRGFD
jgi:hypothetical protein